MCLYSALTAACAVGRIAGRMETQVLLQEGNTSLAAGTGDRSRGAVMSAAGCGALETLERLCGLVHDEAGDEAGMGDRCIGLDWLQAFLPGDGESNARSWTGNLNCNSRLAEPLSCYEAQLTAPALISVLARALCCLECLPSTKCMDAELSSLVARMSHSEMGAGQRDGVAQSSGPSPGPDPCPESQHVENCSPDVHGGQACPIARDGRRNQTHMALRLLACTLRLFLITSPADSADGSVSSSSADCKADPSETTAIWAQLSLEMRKTFTAVMRTGEAHCHVLQHDKSRGVREKQRLRRHVLSAVTRCLQEFGAEGLRATVSRLIEYLRENSRTSRPGRGEVESWQGACEDSSPGGRPRDRQDSRGLPPQDSSGKTRNSRVTAGHGGGTGARKTKRHASAVVDASKEAHTDECYGDVEIEDICLREVVGQLHAEICCVECCAATLQAHLDLLYTLIQQPLPLTMATKVAREVMRAFVQSPIPDGGYKSFVSKAGSPQIMKRLLNLVQLALTAVPLELDNLCVTCVYAAVDSLQSQGLDADSVRSSRSSCWIFPSLHRPTTRNIALGWCLRLLIRSNADNGEQAREASALEAQTDADDLMLDDARRYSLSNLSRKAQIVQAVSTLVSAAVSAATDGVDAIADVDAESEEDTDGSQEADMRHCQHRSHNNTCRSWSSQGLSKSAWRLLGKLTMQHLHYAAQAIRWTCLDENRKGESFEEGSVSAGHCCIRGNKTKDRATNGSEESETEQRKQKLLLIGKEALSAAAGLRQAGDTCGGLVEYAADDAAAALSGMRFWADSGMPSWLQAVLPPLYGTNGFEPCALTVDPAVVKAGERSISSSPADLGRGCLAGHSAAERTRRGSRKKRAKVSSGNAYVRACLLSEGAEDSDDFSDLEDFIECRPSKRY